MDKENEKSNVKLSSNIMIKSRYSLNPWAYIPVDMLPSYYFDTRAAQFLSPEQRAQIQKKMFYATKVVDEE